MFRDRKDELLNLNSKYLQRVLAESNITYVEGETRSQVELLDVLVVPFVKMLSPASSDRNRADSIHIDSRQRIHHSLKTQFPQPRNLNLLFLCFSL
jgi:hypothetical protein